MEFRDCKTSEFEPNVQERVEALIAAAVATERERWRAPVAAALEWMEGAWLRIDGEWGPSGKTLDQECADGDEPEISALRALLGPNV